MATMPEMAFLWILVFAGASFFFALAESALFSLGKYRAQQMAEGSVELGKTVARVLDQPQDLLATIVLGNTLSNGGIVVTALWASWRGEWPMVVTIPAVLFLILVGCEVIPKTLAVRAPEVWSLRLITPVLFLSGVTRPLHRLAQALNNALLRVTVAKRMKPLTTFAEEEYQELVELAYQQGTLAKSEREIILQIIRLDRRTVREVMKPRSQMACISDDISLEEMKAAARKYKHRRLAMYDETPDTIIGILNTRTLLLNPEGGLEEAVEFASFVPESMNLLQLFKSFQRQQRGLAIVLDEFGGTAGLVTMEDILEEVIGPFHSEVEAQEFVMEKLGPERWRVNGTMRLDDFRRQFAELGDPPEVETMGGLLMTLLGVVPLQGQSAVYNGLRLTASAVDERRVREMMVETVRKRGGV